MYELKSNKQTTDVYMYDWNSNKQTTYKALHHQAPSPSPPTINKLLTLT